jgi:UPF0176 protein
MMNTIYDIYAFYKFVQVPHYESYREPLLAAMHEHEILGTILLADEGVNATIAGPSEKMKLFWQLFSAYPEFKDIDYKVSHDDSNPFDKAKVKLRKEIVTLGVPEINPLLAVGEYVKPEEWNTLIQDPEVLVIDTRNTYETYCGTFKGAIDPHTRNFRDFPEYVEQHLLDKKDKKIAMYCTGGIRCEKSTAYLKQLGFEKVYHLEGGILNYLETISPENSLWEGGCFVFDNRISVDHQLNKVPGAVSTKHE